MWSVRAAAESSDTASIALASPAIVCVCVERGGIDSPGIFSPISRVMHAFRNRKGERLNVSVAAYAEHDHESASIVSPNLFF